MNETIVNNFNYNEDKLKIYDGESFINMFYSDDLNEVKINYKTLEEYAFKQKSKIAPELDVEQFREIINFAIMKTIKDFSSEKGASLESYFFIKLRGEVKGFRSKRDALSRKVNRVISEDGFSDKEVGYGYQRNSETEENILEQIDFSDISETMEKEEKTKRQMKAFKMAFSGIPKELQYILYLIGDGKRIKEIAYKMNKTEEEVKIKRDNGLSLILQRVMRGRHLEEEDKKEIAELNGIDYFKEDFES